LIKAHQCRAIAFGEQGSWLCVYLRGDAWAVRFSDNLDGLPNNLLDWLLDVCAAPDQLGKVQISLGQDGSFVAMASRDRCTGGLNSDVEAWLQAHLNEKDGRMFPKVVQMLPEKQLWVSDAWGRTDTTSSRLDRYIKAIQPKDTQQSGWDGNVKSTLVRLPCNLADRFFFESLPRHRR
jgi:hypothetical protein